MSITDVPVPVRFIASAGTYANLVKQAKSKQKIIDKMEAAGLIEKIEMVKPLRFNFEDVAKLPPPILAFNDVAFSYSGKPEDYLCKNLSFGTECVVFHSRIPFARCVFADARLRAAWTRASLSSDRTARASRHC